MPVISDPGDLSQQTQKQGPSQPRLYRGGGRPGTPASRNRAQLFRSENGCSFLLAARQRRPSMAKRKRPAAHWPERFAFAANRRGPLFFRKLLACCSARFSRPQGRAGGNPAGLGKGAASVGIVPRAGRLSPVPPPAEKQAGSREGGTHKGGNRFYHEPKSSARGQGVFFPCKTAARPAREKVQTMQRCPAPRRHAPAPRRRGQSRTRTQPRRRSPAAGLLLCRAYFAAGYAAPPVLLRRRAAFTGAWSPRPPAPLPAFSSAGGANARRRWYRSARRGSRAARSR